MNQSEIQNLMQNLGNHLDDLKTMFTGSEEKSTIKPNSNAWSAKEILGHLFDAELAITFRLKKLAEENNYQFQTFNQNIWVKDHQYNQWDTLLLVDALTALRRNLIFWLGRVSNDIWQRQGQHPEKGKMTFQTLVEFLLSHYDSHVKQIKDRLNG